MIVKKPSSCCTLVAACTIDRPRDARALAWAICHIMQLGFFLARDDSASGSAYAHAGILSRREVPISYSPRSSRAFRRQFTLQCLNKISINFVANAAQRENSSKIPTSRPFANRSFSAAEAQSRSSSGNDLT